MARLAKPKNEKIANSLKSAKTAAGGGHVFQSKKLTRAQVKVLRQAGWLLEIHAGWVALVTPGATEGDTIPFFSNYWEFVQKYLNERLGEDYVLSSISSLALHSDLLTIPLQLTVTTSRTTQGPVQLLCGVALMVISDPKQDVSEAVLRDGGLRILPLEQALASMPAASYRRPTSELTAAVATVRNIPELARILLKNPTGGVVAGRLITAMKDVGRTKDAEMIEKSFAAAGVEISPSNGVGSFSTLDAAGARLKSGIAARLTSMWNQMSVALANAPRPEANIAFFRSATSDEIRVAIREIYINDAYNSLSIEGYQVTPKLVEQVAAGSWDPKQREEDKKIVDALAARGYFEAFNATVQIIIEIHAGAPDIETLERAVLDWRGLLFSPSARAGLIPADSLAGYRRNPVYIRGSMHVPPAHEKLMDAMDAIYDLLRAEKNPWIRAVLGHFFFVHVHPFPDGNGRTGRFLMNALLVTAGYPWTVVRVSQRARYFSALEKASIHGDPSELSDFLMGEMAVGRNVSISDHLSRHYRSQF